MRKIFFLLFLSFLSCKKDADDATSKQTDAKSVLNLVNSARKTGYECATGMILPSGSLQWHSGLEKLALEHSKQMSRQGRIHHDKFQERLNTLGLRVYASAENVASGQKTAQDVMKAWLSSGSGHCENMLFGEYTHIGVARYQDYWTMILAKL